MLAGYITVKEAAEKWGINHRTVQTMCCDGRIAGAVKFGRAWAIPITCDLPKDGRVRSGDYKDWRKKSKNKSL